MPLTTPVTNYTHSPTPSVNCITLLPAVTPVYSAQSTRNVTFSHISPTVNCRHCTLQTLYTLDTPNQPQYHNEFDFNRFLYLILTHKTYKNIMDVQDSFTIFAPEITPWIYTLYSVDSVFSGPHNQKGSHYIKLQ